MGVRAKQKILDILKADEGLKAQVKKENISSDWHDIKKGYPQITVTQITRRPGAYTDDSVYFRFPLLQIDIWSKGNPFIIADLVQQALYEAFGCEAANEREQNAENINRVILEYKIIEI
jgi:hypothetical protein